MILSDEEAKAAQEVAKTTGKAIDLVRGAGSVLVDSTVASIPADALGFVFGGDWLHQVRIRNIARMRAKTGRILDGIDKDRLSAPSPSVVVPLLTAAADETREALQDLWAALLANAMLDRGRKVRRDYFEAVRQMEPVDAILLEIVSRRPFSNSNLAAQMQADNDFIAAELQRLAIPQNDAAIARGKLIALRCLQATPSYDVLPALTPFGKGLVEACSVV